MELWQSCVDFWQSIQLWQIWLAIGILLLIVEMAMPAFFVFFFGIAALLMCLLASIAPNLSFYSQSIWFSVLSFIGIVFFRKFFRSAFTGGKIGRDNVVENDFNGKEAVVVERITPEKSGKVEFNGTNWRARSDTTLEPGTSVVVIGQNNIKLTVAPK